MRDPRRPGHGPLRPAGQGVDHHRRRAAAQPQEPHGPAFRWASWRAVTGVSGSGKTTLVHSILYGQFKHSRGEAVEEVGACDGLEGIDTVDDLILVDQSPIGQSTRSNPVTYVKAYGAIRNLLAETPKARVAGITPADFSFNVAGGRCEVCKGVGTVTYDMYFMADVTVVCQECGGKRFKKKVLDVRWNGKNIDDILDMTVAGAMAHFAEHESDHAPPAAAGRRGPGLPAPGPEHRHALRRRGPAPETRLLPGRPQERRTLALHLRRADDRPPHVRCADAADRPSTGWSTPATRSW